MGLEEGIEPPPALDAAPRLERAGGVVKPGVDYLGIARGNALADAGFLLEHDDRAAALRQRVRASQPHGAGANHDGIEVERNRALPHRPAITHRGKRRERLFGPWPGGPVA